MSIIGDVLSPEGSVVQISTLQSVWTSLAQLPPNELFAYTETVLQRAFDKFDTAIEAAICDSPVGGLRELLARYTASQVSGKWIFTLTGVWDHHSPNHSLTPDSQRTFHPRCTYNSSSHHYIDSVPLRVAGKGTGQKSQTSSRHSS